MKKIILIPAAAGVLAFGGIVLANTDSNNGSNPAAPSTTEVNTSPAATNNQNSGEMIGFEKATAIALAIADGKVTDVELSDDDGRQEYEVEIRDAEYEYDFDIDAFTGDVVEQDRERLKDDDESTENAKVNQNGGQQSSGNKQDNKDSSKAMISSAQAKEIALNETGGGTITDFELDSDDGRQYYEIEIVNGNTEYEMEINAADGSIVEFEQDDDDDRNDDDR